MNKELKAVVGIVSVTPILFLIGVALALFVYSQFPIPLFRGAVAANVFMGIGTAVILAGTALAFWAQKISRVVSRPNVKVTAAADLMQGPYGYSRHPGALSLIIMFVGFVLVTNSLVLLFLQSDWCFC